MNLRLGLLPAALLLASCVTPTAPPVEIPEANVLPLALDSDFDFRKVRRTLNQAELMVAPTRNEVILFEREYLNYGALSTDERRQREGTYFDIYWLAKRPAELTVRFEYRQAQTGNAVLAQEIYVPNARGTMRSSFQVTGDNFQWDGPVTAWRCVLIENNRIVALTQSYLWK